MPFRFCHPRLLPVPAKPACVDGRLRQLEDACGQRVLGTRPPGPSRTRAVVFPATTWPSAARRRHLSTFSAAPSAADVERRPPRPRRSLHLVDVRSPELLKCLEFGSDCVVFTCRENQKQVDNEASEKQHKDVEVAQHDIISRWSSDVLQPFDTAYRAFVRSREAKPNNLHRPEILVTEEMRNLAERGLVDGVVRLEKKTAEKGCGLAEKDSAGGPFLLAQRTLFLRVEESNEDERRLVLVASPATRPLTKSAATPFREIVAQAKEGGFDGVTTFRVTDIPIVHEVFPLTKEEIAFHRGIVFHYETSLPESEERNKSAPFYKRSKKILKRASRLHIDEESARVGGEGDVQAQGGKWVRKVSSRLSSIAQNSGESGSDAVDAMVDQMQGAVYMTPAQLARRKAFYKKHRDQPERYPTVSWITNEQSQALNEEIEKNSEKEK